MGFAIGGAGDAVAQERRGNEENVISFHDKTLRIYELAH